MKLSTPQKTLLRQLDGEKGTMIYARQRRTAKTLWCMGLIEFATVYRGKYAESHQGYRLTHRGLGIVLDLLFASEQRRCR